ncbi:AFG1/ZapE family ATPase [Crystallibacter degradans]|uniref:AFG1/ZapE family ATPase n=1 Tax=Crystallibacter degradans TaxID=2726743 RepID=UPI001475AC86|nr:AFG1/ZapE family ATPase [Arthrobacter sp. SF27]NMR28249.1 cell division protein ZapE [Arthrobacter sp. SF27]
MRGKSQTKQEVLAHFEQRAAAAGFDLDEYQLQAIRQLADVAARTVNASCTAHAPNVVSALASGNQKRRNLYLWGPVGRGKSWLVNEFFTALPFDGKKRWHFHDFFRGLHARRRELQDSSSRPSGTSAVDLAIGLLLQDCTLLVLGEFHVHDPADSQLLAG